MDSCIHFISGQGAHCDWCHVETRTEHENERWLTDSKSKTCESGDAQPVQGGNFHTKVWGSQVNPVNDDERKRVGQAPGNWMLGDSKSEVEHSQVSRQEKVLQAAMKLWQKNQTRIESEENPQGTRNLAACSPECSETWNTYTIGTWIRSFKFGRRSWEYLQSTHDFQWMHTKPMY